MKKVLSSLAFVAFTAVFGQVAITSDTTTTPKATLDVQALGATGVTDGVLIPRMTYAAATAMNGTAVESTMVWLTDGDGTCGKGFYYYDATATDWEPVKSCGGSSNTKTIKRLSAITVSDWDNNQYALVHTTSAGIELPDPATNKDRIIAVSNQYSTTVNYVLNSPANNSALFAGKGHILMSDGTNWYTIGGSY